MKALFVYSKNLKQIWLKKRGEISSTQFRGFVDIGKFGIEANIYESCENWFWKRIKRYLSRLNICLGGFVHLRNVLKFYKLAKTYKVIVADGYNILFTLVFYKILFFWLPIRLIYINIALDKKIKKRDFLKIYLLKKVDKIVCLASYQETYLEKMGIPKDKLVFIPFGSDHRFFVPPKGSGEFILTVGADPGKDFITFIKAMSGINFPVKIVTKKGMVDEKNLSKNVEAIYNLPFKKLRKLYQQAKIVVMPCHSDKVMKGASCPGQTVILDSMLMKKAIIATDRLWFSGYLKSEKNCLIVKPYDISGLRKAIKFLLKNPPELKRLGENARQLALEKFTQEKFSEGLAKVIKDIL